jgi:two-component system, cell cycle response regulator DivK
MSTFKQILIVDDDSRNIFALSAVLKAKGYKCLSAASAREALVLLESHGDIGIVLMDMMMPDMDGYEAIGKIRADDAKKDTPVVAVTAQAMVGDREKCLAAGADAYLSKPVNVDVLTETLKELLN